MDRAAPSIFLPGPRRHASRQGEQGGGSDAERALTDRGVDDAAAAGAWIAGQGVTPDHALVSGAVRTRQTWEAVARGAGSAVEADFDEGLYATGPESALDLIRTVPDEVQALVVIGHNPTVAYLAQLLDDGEGDDGAGNDMAMGFPTSAVAVLEYDGTWAELEPQSASLVGFHVGRA